MPARVSLLPVLAFALAATASAQPHAASATGGDSFVSAVKGYAWANQPAASSYTPARAYSYNAAGGGVVVTRQATGRYTVRFEGLGGSAAGGNVHVSAYNSAATCSSGLWTSSATDLDVQVECVQPSGVTTDARFTVLFVSASGLVLPQLGYAWANEETAGSYQPSALYSYNGGGGPVLAQRLGTGWYKVTFEGITSPRGTAQVTAYRSPARCQTFKWARNASGTGLEVEVLCNGPDGAAVDSRFTLLYVGQDGLTDDIGYTFAHLSTDAQYQPLNNYSYNANGGITASRTGAGDYSLSFEGLGGVEAGGLVLVTAFGSPVSECNVGGWTSAGDVDVEVDCYGRDGSRTDSRYTALVVWPQRQGVDAETGPAPAFALDVAPNPVSGASVLRFRLDAPGEARLAVYDALGREVAVLADGRRAAGEHTESLDVSPLTPGIYVARLVAGGQRAARTFVVVL